MLASHPGKVIAVAALVSMVLAASCGGGSGAPPAITCPNDVPAACPTPAPGFAADVAPILQDRCGACHVPGGVEAVRSLQTYDEVKAQLTSVLTQIHACLMPPQDNPQLTSDERRVVLGWIVCGGMND